MLYLLDEGWPPDFASRLNAEFYSAAASPVVHHARRLGFASAPDRAWINALESRTRALGENWTVITRDQMRQHRRIMFDSPLRFAVLGDDLWARARKPDLWLQLTTHWPRLHAYAISSSANVFRVAYDGRIYEYLPPE